LLGNNPSGFCQGDRRGHARVGNFQDRSGWEAIHIPARERIGVPPQKGHEHLVKRNLRRQTDHSDLARSIAGLDLDFFTLNFAGLRFKDPDPVFAD
jgi:hypothetical protein